MNKIYKVISVDGEGYFNTEQSSHFYDIFSVGDETISGNGWALQPHQVFGLLRSVTIRELENGITPIFVGYFLNYDFTQWLRYCDEYQLKRLYNRDGRTHAGSKNKFKEAPRYKKIGGYTTPVKLDIGNTFSPYRYKVDYLEGKYLTVSFPDDASLREARLKRDEKSIVWLTIKIQDMGSIFGTGFVNALQSMNVDLPGDMLQVLVDGKANRANNNTFEERASYISEVVYYNQHEMYTMSILAVKIAQILNILEVDINPQHGYSGIGSIASAVLKQRANNNHIITSWDLAETITPRVYQDINSSYFGGHAETFRLGLIDNVYQYDITSAYPNVTKDLPCLNDALVSKCSSIAQAQKVTDNGSLCFVKVRVSGSNDYLGPLPFRTPQDAVLRPRNVIGWYLWDEVQASIDAGLISEIELLDGHIITSQCACKPFAWIEELFNERIRVGKKTAHGGMLKLIINSVYGKLAQSIGNPQFANPIYASVITARTRAQLLNAIGSHPNGLQSLIATATDAVFFDSPINTLDLTPQKLGAWELTKFDKAFFLKPGIWGGTNIVNSDDSCDWTVKTRGVSIAAFREDLDKNVIQKLTEFMLKGEWDSEYSFTARASFSMLTIGEAAIRDRWDLVGEFMVGDHGLPEMAREVQFSVFPKRSRIWWDDDLGFVTSTAFWVGEELLDYPTSTPYNKRIGSVNF